jgi:glycosyltransferase involved in cell wall biosynthesis
MTRVSLLIAQRNAGSLVTEQVPAACRALHRLTGDFEVLVVDDASSPEDFASLTDLLGTVPNLQLLRLDRPCGLSAALTAGMHAARGQFLINLPAGNPASAELIEPLLEALVRADLVVGRPRRGACRKALHRLIRIPRWFLLGLEVRDPECQVWAARREALDGLHLPRGMYRYLATLVSARGYRVGEISVPIPGRSIQLWDGYANPGDLLAAWWLKKRWRPYEVTRARDAAGTASPEQPNSVDETAMESPTPKLWRRSA